MPKARAWGAVGAVVALFLLGVSAPVWLGFPKQLRLFPGQEYVLRTGPLFTVAQPASGDAGIVYRDGGNPTLKGSTLGEHSVQLKMLGLLPVRAARVQVVPEVQVVPGGQAVGVLLSAAGLLVVRTVEVEGVDGHPYSPAREADIQAGDVILRVGRYDLVHPRQIEEEARLWGERGLAMPVTILREGRTLVREVKPVLGHDPTGPGQRYLIGVYLKDPAAGVGTLTFWDPITRRFGALGHMITDDDRGAVMVTDGRIVPAHIHSVEPGVKGRPGEKLGLFDDRAGALGTIDTNTQFGIFGTMIRLPEGPVRSLPVALAQEVVPGPAEMLTVLEGDLVESFGVEILDVTRQYRPSGKGLVIRVTDPRLMRRTNGIVQGMSGSPIIQNNKLVGAVTHVYVNDPTRGFGILAEWMVYESGVAGGDTSARSEPAA